MKKIVIGVFLLSFLNACAISKTKLTSDGMMVKVLEGSLKNNCDVVDKVIGENENGSRELAQNHARNLAGDLGANSISFDETIQNGHNFKIYSTAYNCKK